MFGMLININMIIIIIVQPVLHEKIACYTDTKMNNVHELYAHAW